MDAAKALDDLKELSTQVLDAVVFQPDGAVIASTASEQAAQAMAQAAVRLLDEAGRSAFADKRLVQLEAASPEGSVAVVRDEERAIAATTAPEPTIGLVFYDLRTVLRQVAEEPDKKPDKKAKAKPARKRSSPRKKAKADDADAAA